MLFKIKDGTDGVVSTASTTTSNPLSTLYCYDISETFVATTTMFRFVIRMFDQNTSVVIKATKYEIDTFASQVARNHAIAVYPHAYDE